MRPAADRLEAALAEVEIRSPGVPVISNVTAQAVEGPVTAMNPASVLQMHPVAKICLDEAAAGALEKAAYYRWVYDNKPAWQRV